jgi:large subunit ribosomal protein L30
MGMLNIVKNTVTWGEINEQTFRILLEKRGRLPAKQQLTEAYLKEKVKMSFDEFAKKFMEGKAELKDVPGLKSFFTLSPPRQGFEKKGMKEQYAMGGALGYRKDKINELIQRMI